MRLNQIGLGLDRGSKMRHRGIGFALLGQDPTQRRLRVRIIRGKLARLFEFGARPGNVSFLEGLLATLKSQSLRGFRGRRRRLRERTDIHHERCRAKENSEPRKLLEHDEWKLFSLFRIITNARVRPCVCYDITGTARLRGPCAAVSLKPCQFPDELSCNPPALPGSLQRGLASPRSLPNQIRRPYIANWHPIRFVPSITCFPPTIG